MYVGMRVWTYVYGGHVMSTLYMRVCGWLGACGAGAEGCTKLEQAQSLGQVEG